MRMSDPESESPLEKVPTGIRGLDEILHGGLPTGALTLLAGGAGTGKTMMGMEFLVHGAETGQAGILLSFEERADSLRRYASGLGWDLPSLEGRGLLRLISARLKPDSMVSGDFDLGAVMAILQQAVDELGARRVLIDAPDVLLRLLDDPARERAELYALHEWLLDSGTAAMMTVKASDGEDVAPYGFLDYMAECVIHLDQRVRDQVTTRRMRVVKYRGSSYGGNEYPFGITDRGLRIIPVTETSLKHRAMGRDISSGVPDLDRLLAGGYRRGSCTLITGGSGTGKTTFLSSFALSAAESGETVLYLDFEESRDALFTCMLSPGLDLRPAWESGRLRFLSAMPESKGIEKHLIQAFRALEDYRPGHLVVDAISASRRMGSEGSAFDYLLRLINHCKQLGVTTLLANLASSESEGREITGVDLSSVIDTVIMLRYVEVHGGYVRELGILKSRGRDHSHRIHRFRITDGGIRIEAGEDDLG
jgi:circadian clock protein KaiC